MRRAVVGVALALGCSDGSQLGKADDGAAASRYEPLVALDAFSAVGRSQDPFVGDPEAAAACIPSFRYEADQHRLEIDTTLCNWITLKTEPLGAVDAGQPLRIDFSHYDLDAPEPAEATLRLRFGVCDVWSEMIPIPSSANVARAELASPCALDESRAAADGGEAIFFHLDNHGQNTYQLQGISVLR